MTRGKRKDAFDKLADAAVAYADANMQWHANPDSKREQNKFQSRLTKLMDAATEAAKEIADQEGEEPDDQETVLEAAEG